MGLENVASKGYENEFDIQYKGSATLGGGIATKMYHGLTGTSWQVPILGHSSMKKRGAYGTPLPLVVRDVTPSVMTFEEFGMREAVDTYEQTLLDADEFGELPTLLGESAQRMVTQVILDALNDVPDSDAGLVITDGTGDMTLAKLQEVKAAFDKKGVNKQDRFIAMGTSQEQSLLSEEKVTSSLYNTQKNLETGSLTQILGMTVIIIPEMDEGGLPQDGVTATPTVTCFAWSRSCIATGFKKDPSVRIWFNEDSECNMTSVGMIVGSKVSLPLGMAKIACTQANPL